MLREGYEAPINAPVDAALYRILANEAAEKGMSLYALVAQKLGKAIDTTIQIAQE